MLLVGAGPMAVDYARVLIDIGTPFEVVCRTQSSADRFFRHTGHEVQTGGLESYLNAGDAPKEAIVAVDVPDLSAVCLSLLKAGVQSILLEKPAGMSASEVQDVQNVAEAGGAWVVVAYNRRFYASTLSAKKQILADGGLRAIDFDFTEWPDRVLAAPTTADVKRRWVIANSSHVIDLAFHLAGNPMEWNSWVTGGLEWHHSGSRFVGAGITENDVPFSYRATWDAPGRWGITLWTASSRCILRPLETLQISQDGISDAVAEIDDELDTKFKPGLYRQVQAFLEHDRETLCSLSDHVEMMRIYERIGGYGGV